MSSTRQRYVSCKMLLFAAVFGVWSFNAQAQSYHAAQIDFVLESGEHVRVVADEQDSQFVFQFRPFTVRAYVIRQIDGQDIAREISVDTGSLYHYRAYLEDFSLGLTHVVAFSVEGSATDHFVVFFNTTDHGYAIRTSEPEMFDSDRIFLGNRLVLPDLPERLINVATITRSQP